MAKTLQALPEVARAITLSSFVPEGQDQKLAAIKEKADLLHDKLYPAQVKPKPTGAEIVSSLEATAASLGALASQRQGTGSQAAKNLSEALANLAKASAETRERAADVLIPPLDITLENLRMSLNPDRITLDNLPPDLVGQWRTPDGRARVSVTPKGDANNTEVLQRFVDAVLKVEPMATGEAIGIQKAGETVVSAFIEAGIWALLSISILLWLFLRRVSDVGLTLFPLILAAMVTLEICSAIGFKLNFANIIALPVLLGLGVAFKIYYIVAWRQGQTDLLASPLTLRCLLQRFDHGGGFRQPVDVEPSRDVQHGAIACAVACLHDGGRNPLSTASHGAAEEEGGTKPSPRERSFVATIGGRAFSEEPDLQNVWG